MHMNMTPDRRRKAVAATTLFILIAIPLFINGTGMERSVRYFTPMPYGVERASVELHAWWLSALIMAGMLGSFLLLLLVKGILGLGPANATVIFATVGIMGVATALNQLPRSPGIIYGGGPRCIVFGGGGGGNSGGSPAPAAAAPAPAPAPSGASGAGV